DECNFQRFGYVVDEHVITDFFPISVDGRRLTTPRCRDEARDCVLGVLPGSVDKRQAERRERYGVFLAPDAQLMLGTQLRRAISSQRVARMIFSYRQASGAPVDFDAAREDDRARGGG